MGRNLMGRNFLKKVSPQTPLQKLSNKKAAQTLLVSP
jgi:hypothetical protein